jgi:hypothetical protein
MRVTNINYVGLNRKMGEEFWELRDKIIQSIDDFEHNDLDLDANGMEDDDSKISETIRVKLDAIWDECKHIISMFPSEMQEFITTTLT